MFRNITFALIVAFGFSAKIASAENISTNSVPANTIKVSALLDKKDVVVVHGDKLWIAHLKGEFPKNVEINGVSWSPEWDNNESSVYTMKEPPRFLPMHEHRGLLSISLAQTNIVAKVIEYPNASNEWTLMVALIVKSEESTQADLIISWENNPIPIVLPTYETPTTKPNPTPTGLI